MPHLTHYSGYARSKPAAFARLNRRAFVRPNTCALALNERAGTRARDLSGSNNDGTLSGDALWTTIPGLPNASVQFNLNAHNGKLAFSPGLVLGATFSMAFRLYAMVNSNSYCALLADSGSANGLFYRSSTNKLDMVYSGLDHQNNTALSILTEHDVVITANAGAITFYVDGKVDGTFTGWPGFTAVNVANDAFAEYWVGHMAHFFAANGVCWTPGQVWKLFTRRYELLEAAPTYRYYPTRYYGVGGATLGNLSVAGTGSFAGPVYGGDGGSVLGNLSVVGTGSFTGPTFGGSGGATLSNQSVAGMGAFSAPFTLATLINSKLAEDATDPFEIDSTQAQVTPL